MPSLYDGIKRANSQYVPQFVGSNADTIKSVADVLSTRSLQNEQNLTDKLALAINEQYAPGDEYIGENIYKELDNLRNQVASSDEGFENSGLIVRNAVRDKVLTNRDRIEGLRNKKQYDLYEAQLRELGPEAEDFSPKFTGTINPDGTYNRFVPRVEKRLDYDKRKESFFNQLEADLLQSPFKADAKNPGFLKSVLTGGIADPRVKGYVDKALERYKGSSEYDQEFRKYKRDTDLTDEEINEKIKKSILATGLERVHNIRKEDLERIPEYLANGAGRTTTPPPYTPTSPTAPATNSYQKELVSPTTADEIEYDEETGKYYKVGIPEGWKAEGAGALPPKVRLGEVPNPNSNEPGTASYQYNKLVQQDPEFLKSVGINNVQDFIKSYNEAKDKNKAIAVPGIQIDPEQAKLYDDVIQRNLLSNEIYIEGSNKGVSADEAEVEYGTDGKPRIQVVKIVPVLPNSSLEGGGAEVLLLRKDAKPTRAFVRLNDSFTEQTKWMNKVLGASTFASQDLNDISNPLVNDDPYSIRADEAGNQYKEIAYTMTAPTPKARRAFKSKIVQGIRIEKPNGDYQDLFGKDAEALFEDKKFGVLSDEQFQALETLRAKQRLTGGVNTAETVKKDRD